MQSAGEVKKLQDYSPGEWVFEEGKPTGRVVAVSVADRNAGYLLLVNREEYTIYRGLTDALCSLSLARKIPQSVMLEFSKIMLNGHDLPEEKEPATRAFAAAGKTLRHEPTVLDESEELEADVSGPYFDFV
jgi:hypothetical protein